LLEKEEIKNKVEEKKEKNNQGEIELENYFEKEKVKEIINFINNEKNIDLENMNGIKFLLFKKKKKKKKDKDIFLIPNIEDKEKRKLIHEIFKKVNKKKLKKNFTNITTDTEIIKEEKFIRLRYKNLCNMMQGDKEQRSKKPINKKKKTKDSKSKRTGIRRYLITLNLFY
jgi:hypothetical protein